LPVPVHEPKEGTEDTSPTLHKHDSYSNPVGFTALLRHQNGTTLPDDLAKLAALWPKIPAAVREGWLATAEALTKGNA
jgi:hypothetical protein